MKDIDHVVLGALLHDIGKFFERGELLGEYRNNDEQEQDDCPWNHQGGYRSHKHVLHSRRFCEVLFEHLTALKPQSYQRIKTADQHWVNLTARHHVASTSLEVLVQHAGHLASAKREDGEYCERRTHQKTYLESMLERVNLDKKSKETHYRLPLTESVANKSAIFPQTTQQLGMQKNESGVWLSQDNLKDDYARLGHSLFRDLENLPKPHTTSPEALRSTVTSLLALFERYLAQVPAATNVKHPDVSLFDHLRTTAAIAEGLYHHHASLGELDNRDAIMREDTAKWRLVCGDFSGIQSFIYRITSKGAAKALRGRSLYIQLLCDIVSDHLLQRMELYATARIYASGGKFYLLIADCLEEKLREEVNKVNKWLLQEFGGDVFLGLGIAPVSAKDFAGGAMSEKWKEANDDLMLNRNQRFASQMDASFFTPTESLDKGQHCKVCGKDDLQADLKEGSCQQCRMLERLGQGLSDANYFFYVRGDDRKLVADNLKNESCFSFSSPLDVDLYLLSEAPSFSEGLALHASRLERLNDVDCMDGNWHGYACSYRWLGKWDKDKDSSNWEFDEFAEQAQGIKRIGVLRMDVDNLGQLFIRGFAWAEKKQMGSLSRVATLSRQLNMFFSGYIMQLLKDEHKAQIIYAGGDDIFLIGSWDVLPEVANHIRQDFQAFAAFNPDFSISGGISMVRGKYPIASAAELAGEAEAKAKLWQRKVGSLSVDKNALCMLDTVIGWEDYTAVEKLRDMLASASKSNHAILSRMREVVQAHKTYLLLNSSAGVERSEIADLAQWQKWRWQLVYQLQRLAKRNPVLEEEIQQIRKALLENNIDGRESDTLVLDWLALPTRWTEYLQRERK